MHLREVLYMSLTLNIEDDPESQGSADDVTRLKEQISSLTKELHVTRIRLANEIRDKRDQLGRISSLEQAYMDTLKDLEEVRATLKIILENRNQERAVFEKQVMYHVKDLTLPFIERLRKSVRDPESRLNLEIIEANICKNIGKLVHTSIPYDSRLTSTELKVATLITDGRTTTEISSLMCLSPRSVEYYRNNIRNKLGLKDIKVPLRKYLSSFQSEVPIEAEASSAPDHVRPDVPSIQG